MSKKIVALLSGIVLLFSSSLMAYADHSPLMKEERIGGIIQPFYVAVSRVSATMRISSGTATCTVIVTPKSKTSLDYIQTTVKILDVQGNSVKTWNNIKSDKTGSIFAFDESFKLSKKGQYQMTYTSKCYKDGKVVDTDSGTTRLITY